MHWKSLLQASEIYRRQEARDPFYSRYMNSKDPMVWDSKSGPNDNEIQKLFTFLNQWSTHYPSDSDARVRFRKAYLVVLPLLRALKRQSLVEIGFERRVGGGMTKAEAISTIFEKIATAGSRYESTGTSKILHVLYPRLFVMWDSAICGGYAVTGRSTDYAERFLPQMQREAREAIGSYIVDGESGPTRAVHKIEKLCGGRPLTKLVDEYNYCKFTLRAQEVWG